MIKQINNETDAIYCDTLLTKLILDEKKYDDSIDENFTVNNYFNQVIKNKDNILLGYYVEEKIVGYIFIKKIDDTTCLLDGLYVDKDYRNNKIATSLIEDAINRCKVLNYKYIDINVMYKNETAKYIYKKFGFNEFRLSLRKEL